MPDTASYFKMYIMFLICHCFALRDLKNFMYMYCMYSMQITGYENMDIHTLDILPYFNDFWVPGMNCRFDCL